MKHLDTLRLLISVFFYLLCFSILIIIGVAIGKYFFEGFSAININDKIAQLPQEGKIISAFIHLLVFCMQVYSVFLLKKFIYNINSKQLFTNNQIKWLNWIGSLIIASTLIKSISEFLVQTIFTSTTEISIVGGSDQIYNSSLFMLIVGLLFLLLSSIFRISRDLKKENELTV